MLIGKSSAEEDFKTTEEIGNNDGDEGGWGEKHNWGDH